MVGEKRSSKIREHRLDGMMLLGKEAEQALNGAASVLPALPTWADVRGEKKTCHSPVAICRIFLVKDVRLHVNIKYQQRVSS